MQVIATVTKCQIQNFPGPNELCLVSVSKCSEETPLTPRCNVILHSHLSEQACSLHSSSRSPPLITPYIDHHLDRYQLSNGPGRQPAINATRSHYRVCTCPLLSCEIYLKSHIPPHRCSQSSNPHPTVLSALFPHNVNLCTLPSPYPSPRSCSSLPIIPP